MKQTHTPLLRRGDLSKTVRLSGIYFAAVVFLLVCRLTFAYLPLSDNAASWLFSSLYQVVGLGLLPWVLYRTTLSASFSDFCSDFSLHPRVHPLLYLIALPLGLLTFFLNVGVSAIWYNVLRLSGYVYTAAPGVLYTSPEVLVMEILTSCLLPAFFEEVVNRGMLCGAFRNERNDSAVILLLALSFGLWHQNAPQTLPTMVGGFVMAYMCVKCGSAFPGMIVHFINNFIITLAEYSSQNGGVFYAFYRRVIGALSANFLVLLLSMAVAAIATAILLGVFARVGTPYRDRAYPGRPGLAPQEKLFGFFQLGESTPTPLARAEKWEYAFFVAALLLTFVTTLFTYIWGVLR